MMQCCHMEGPSVRCWHCHDLQMVPENKPLVFTEGPCRVSEHCAWASSPCPTSGHGGLLPEGRKLGTAGPWTCRGCRGRE